MPNPTRHGEPSGAMGARPGQRPRRTTTTRTLPVVPEGSRRVAPARSTTAREHGGGGPPSTELTGHAHALNEPRAPRARRTATVRRAVRWAPPRAVWNTGAPYAASASVSPSVLRSATAPAPRTAEPDEIEPIGPT